MIWKKKSKILIKIKSKLYIKQFCLIVWSVEKVHRVKLQK